MHSGYNKWQDVVQTNSRRIDRMTRREWRGKRLRSEIPLTAENIINFDQLLFSAPFLCFG